VKNASYAYSVLPGTTLEECGEKVKRSVSAVNFFNKETVQAVFHTDLKVLSAVFWHSGPLSLGFDVR